mmetsp:Transcript_20758/g.61987  ORF Transcript_20758/g.61987 Transcript_20758/m.61987 type:complete len:455 (+) Transcript_20758:322-1686(+)
MLAATAAAAAALVVLLVLRVLLLLRVLLVLWVLLVWLLRVLLLLHHVAVRGAMAAAATATSALCEERDQRACGGGAGSGGVVLLRDGVVAEEHPATGRLRDNAGHAIRRLRGARRLLRHAPASWAQWGALDVHRPPCRPLGQRPLLLRLHVDRRAVGLAGRLLGACAPAGLDLPALLRHALPSRQLVLLLSRLLLQLALLLLLLLQRRPLQHQLLLLLPRQAHHDLGRLLLLLLLEHLFLLLGLARVDEALGRHLDKLWNRRAAPCLVNDALCQQHLGCALGHFDDAASGRAHERGLTVGQLGGGWRRACALGLQRLRGGNARRHGEPCTCMHARTHACQFADSLVCGQSSLHAWGLTVGIECEGRVTRACSAIKVEHTQTCIASGMQACMQCDRSEAHAKHVHPWACNHAMQDDLRVQLNADSTQGMRHVQQYQRTHGGGSGADSPRSWRPLR